MSKTEIQIRPINIQGIIILIHPIFLALLSGWWEYLYVYIFIIPGVIFGIIFNLKTKVYLERDRLIIKTWPLKKAVIPFNKIVKVSFERTFYGGSKALMIKVDPAYLAKHFPDRVITKRWHFIIGNIKEKDAQKIISQIKTASPLKEKVSKISESKIEKRADLVLKLNRIGFISVISMILILFLFLKIWPIGFFYLFPGVFFVIGINMIVRDYLIYKKIGVEYGPEIWTPSQLKKERGMVRGKWARTTSLVGMFCGIGMILLSIMWWILILSMLSNP